MLKSAGFILLGFIAASDAWPQTQPAAARPADPNRDRLVTLVGDWNVDVVYVLPGGERRSTAQMHSEWILNRHFVRQEYTASMGQSVFTTLQFLGYDPIRKKFSILKMDNLDDAMLYADGDASADGRVITFTGMRSDMMTRSTGSLRQVLTLTDSDHFTLEWYWTPKDGAESKTVAMVHTRKAVSK